MAKRDYAAAAIQLKNAAQKENTGEVRYLLASSLIELGDYSGAEIHLRKAQDLRYAPELVYPALARVMMGQGEAKKLVEELGNVAIPDAATQCAIKSSIGEAYLVLGDRAKAREAFSVALKLAPGDARARVGEARIAAAAGDIVSANGVADEILANVADNTHALSLKADLFVSQGKVDEAIAVLSKLVAASPFDGQARFVLISLLIGADRFNQAAADIASMQKVLPNDIRGRYLEATLAFRKNEPLRARDVVIQVLNVLPDHAPSLMLAGAAEYQLGSLATAADYLRKAVAKNPGSTYARNLLATTYLRQGQPVKAEEAITPALKLAPQDANVLRTAGEVALAKNQLTDAARFYDRALATEKDSVALKTRLAQIRLANGEMERAIADLELTSNLDKDQYQADLSLISAHLVARQFDKALQAVGKLEKKQPDNPLTFNLKGSAQIGKSDVKSARISFEKALLLQPTYLPAARNLARLDVAEKRPALATARFNAILEKEPNNEGAWLALAEAQMMTGAPAKEVKETLSKAISIDQKSAPARLALIDFLAKNRDLAGAMAAATAAHNAIPDEPRLLDALGAAQLAAGQTAQAIESFKKLATLQPDSPLPLLRLASAQFASKQVDVPLQALRKALAMQPDLLDAQRDIVTLQLAAGKPEEALKETRVIQKARPKEGIGFALEGDVLASQKKFSEATRAYAEALKRQATPELIVKQHQLMLMGGKTWEAKSLTTQWVKDNPNEPIVRFYLATLLMQEKAYKEAAQGYREILAIQPDNVATLNNLAWVLSQMKDASALSYAERAYLQAPLNPSIQNTYGWLLFSDENAESRERNRKHGLELLTQSAVAAPNDADIRLHLAKAMVKSGDKVGGIKELQAVIRLGESTAKTEAELLLKSL